MAAMPADYSLAGKRVWIAGHGGLVGQALLRRLQGAGCQLLTVPRARLDLRRQADVEAWVARERPQAVFLLAATVGGILANDKRPVDFLYDNLAIATNLIHAAAQGGVEKLMFLGSACFYPRLAELPIREGSLLTGPLEPTNEWYAVAKIAGLKLCQAYRRQEGRNFITVVPTTLFGPGDNFDPDASHVVSALLRKIHAAKASGAGPVEIWGTGSPRREFLYVDDAADALVFVMERYAGEAPLNVGSGEDVSIGELAGLLANVVGYRGEFRFDTSRPDGMPRKLLDSGRIRALGWRPKVTLRDGLRRTYKWYLEQLTASAERTGAVPPAGSSRRPTSRSRAT
jgi:GDP-L-fucose synthase